MTRKQATELERQRDELALLMTRLTPRQRAFCEAVWGGARGAWRAAELAGYRWPERQGPRLRTFPAVAAVLRLHSAIHLEEWRADQREQRRRDAARLRAFLAQPGRRGPYRRRQHG